MSHSLPGLPYAYDALEPHIDARTMEIHHGKHHQAYINNLNAALEGHSELADKTALELVMDLDAVPESPLRGGTESRRALRLAECVGADRTHRMVRQAAQALTEARQAFEGAFPDLLVQ